MNSPALQKLFAAMAQSPGIPALENTVTAVLSDLNNFRKGHRDVAARIVEDAALTQRVLKLANSAMYAAFANSAGSVSAAVIILGADAVLHIVLGTAMITAAQLEEDESLSKVLLSAELARSAYEERSEDVSIAALMFDLGALMANRYLPQEMKAVHLQALKGTGAEQAERAVLGMTLQEIGAAVASRWKLPGSIVSIIDGSGDATLVEVARFSRDVSALIYSGQVEEAEKRAAELKIPGTNAGKVLALVTQKVQEIQPVQVPAAAAVVGSEVQLGNLFADLSAREKLTVDELCALMFPPLAETLRASHCLLFMATRQGDFAIRCGHGNQLAELKKGFRISATFKPTAFHAAIKNNVDVSIADVTKLKPTALIEGYAQLLPDVRQFIVLPIGGKRVGGFLYCDWENSLRLSPSELEVTKKLRTLFLPYMAS